MHNSCPTIILLSRGWHDCCTIFVANLAEKKKNKEKWMPKVSTIADDWLITMWMWQILILLIHQSNTHRCTQKCSFPLTAGCCWFQLVDPTSDTGAQESLLIGCSYRNECVKGNWGQTVDPGKRKDAENDRREGTREEREADGHGLSRDASVWRGGEEDPFRWSTKAKGHIECASVGLRVCSGCRVTHLKTCIQSEHTCVKQLSVLKKRCG